MTSPFRLLVIADVHYAATAEDAAGAPARRDCHAGRELLRRAVDDAVVRGGVDAVALLGDLLNGGDTPSAEATLAALRNEIRVVLPETPILLVPGNHDGDAARALTVFGTRPGLHEIGGYRFLVFADAYDAGDRCMRSEADARLLDRIGRTFGGPIVVLQHNPVWPPIDDPYPFTLTGADTLVRDYAHAGVTLSVSGHFHAGQPLSTREGMQFLTAPALCEAPFRYALVTLEGSRVSVETRSLQLPESPPLVDSHCHTEFAYCAADVTGPRVVERGRKMGLAGVCLVEHAPQLYMDADDFFTGQHVPHPELWRTNDTSRMAAFRRTIEPLRSPTVRIGLEVEMDREGRMTLHDEDREWPDLLVGAVHFIGEDLKEVSRARLLSLFMKSTEGLLGAGVDILAHPWRIFRWARQPIPTELFAPVADVLRATGTAAEINLHGNAPDLDFFALCVARGVKIALGSDAHCLHEVGTIGPHLDILRQAAGTDDVAPLLLFQS